MSCRDDENSFFNPHETSSLNIIKNKNEAMLRDVFSDALEEVAREAYGALKHVWIVRAEYAPDFPSPGGYGPPLVFSNLHSAMERYTEMMENREKLRISNISCERFEILDRKNA